MRRLARLGRLRRPDPLRRHLELRLQEVRGLAAAGTLRDEQIEELLHLDQAVRLARRLRRPPGRAMVLLGVAALLILLAFLLRPLGSAEMELDLVVSGLDFTLDERHFLTPALDVEALRVDGLREVLLPEGPEGTGGREGALGVRLGKQAAPVGQPGRAILTLARLISGPGTRISLHREGGSGLRVRLGAVGDELRVDAMGPLEAAFASAGQRLLDLTVPRPIRLVPRYGAPVDLALTLPPRFRAVLARELTVSELVFERVEQAETPTGPLARRVPTILSGEMRFPELDGVSRKLRGAERVRLQRARGILHTVALEDEHLVVHFRGRVDGITLEPEGRSLMPTHLEWLRRHHMLGLVAGSLFSLFAALFTILQWRRMLA